MKKLIFLITFLMAGICSNAQLTKQVEKYYQDLFAEVVKGQKEIVLKDDSRVDIVTDTFAIEVDFADKWAESIGQSHHYGLLLNKKSGILLVVNGKLDDRYVQRLMPDAIQLGITVWLLDYNTNKWYRVKPVVIYPYHF